MTDSEISSIGRIREVTYEYDGMIHVAEWKSLKKQAVGRQWCLVTKEGGIILPITSLRHISDEMAKMQAPPKQKKKRPVGVHTPSKKHGNMERIGVFDLNDVLPYIVGRKNKGNRKTYTVDGKSYVVNMFSARLRLFTRDRTCCKCGVEGRFFALERSKTENPNRGYHFNLYGVDKDGNEVLMTKDHVVPKSKGGCDAIDNMQTMCKVCNELKGNKDEDANV